MSTNRGIASCSVDDVFAVLSEGWLYGAWVVGTSRIRAVDHDWPSVGSRLHHSVGVWPAVIDGTTTVLAAVPGERLLLLAEGWPLGAAQVEVTLSGDANGCSIMVHERAIRGLGSWLPDHVEDVLLHVRNAEAVRRLILLAEGGAPRGGSDLID